MQTMNAWRTIAVSSLGGALLLIIAAEIDSGLAWSDPPMLTAPDRGEQLHDSIAQPLKMADNSAILARPLFNWNRRPGLSSGVAADGPLPRLAGIVVSGTGRYAIFAAPSGGKPQVVQEGSVIGRYTIDKITADQIILNDGHDSQKLHTSFGITPPPPMPTPDAS